MDKIKKLLSLLDSMERKRAIQLLIMILVMALLDMIGVASIMPFIAVLANPELVEANATLKTLFYALRLLGVKTTHEFLFITGFLVFLLLVVSLAFKALTTYVQTHFTLLCEYSIGKRLIEGYLRQPYSWFLSRHSAEMGKTILSEVSAVIYGSLIPVMNLIAQGSVAVGLMLLLVLIDPLLALTAGFVLGASYALVFKLTAGFLTRIGTSRFSANNSRFVAVNEAFSAVKEVKASGLEEAYVKRFTIPAKIYAEHQASAQIIGQLPRFALEIIAFGGLMLVILYLMSRNGNFSNALPIIALYAFAGYRLMPALQATYGAVTQLLYHESALDTLHKDMSSLIPDNRCSIMERVPLQTSITLNCIRYRYPNAAKFALNGLTMTIPAGSKVGIVGSTGSGKTTTVDLILGLLEVQDGLFQVDGENITKNNSRAWQRSIGYVPQQIFIADDTIEANIAFGIDSNDIDKIAVERSARIANLHNFVELELPEQYHTKVGERGVRLSGGQRQRIGIARALYHYPQILIMDEATSALDNLTEQEVMGAVHNLDKTTTVILIAHRLSTVKECDIIFLLEKGEVQGFGKFDELIKSNEKFREMAEF